ncbi:MAG: hypothetical protein JNL98_08300 [Bryobacterales bacterium]|nr:hypothetical protein [Bryobacterales bacterium]
MKVKRTLSLFLALENLRRTGGPIAVTLLAMVWLSACHHTPTESGAVRTSEKAVEGNAEKVRLEVHQPVGELRIRPGATKLLNASFRYSEHLGEPEVTYEGTSGSGRLVVSKKREREKTITFGSMTNEWTLQLSDKPTYDVHLEMGAGSGEIDLSKFTLRGVSVQVGAGEVDLDVSGAQKRDVDVKIQGGVGAATVILPKAMGVEARVQKGIGGVEIKGLTKKGELYYNDAYAEGKPVMKLTVQTGVGLVELKVAE